MGDEIHAEIFDMVLQTEGPASARTAADLARKVTRSWLETGNAYYLDFAVVLCGQLEIPIPVSLQTQLERAAILRLTGSERAGTAAAVIKDFEHDRAFERIANYRAIGFSLKEAASKTAQSMAESSKHPMKASSLEKKYSQSEWSRKEASLREEASRSGLLKHLRELAERAPNADERLLGSRR